MKTIAPISGRLAVITGASLIAGAIPLPFLPDRVLLHLRGAVAHEACSRHGISLETDARSTLAAPHTEDKMRTALRKFAEWITKRVLRRLGPLGPLAAITGAIEVFALGHIMNRYLSEKRDHVHLRMRSDEAREIRALVDKCVMRAIYPSTTASPLMLPQATEDLRDEFTRWVDTILLTGSTLPNYLVRRLDAAYDDVMTESSIGVV